ncbi:MAG: wax ester/triacylglycerol synthase family O-acyltransferase [Xanthomonadales bacterium]|nr:wax ester/triacylglycerol synthase family O-acyltransferase [Xanthomonadales bacterium]
MHKLSALDSGFLLTESHHSPKHVGGLQILRLPRGKGSAWLRSLLDELKQVSPGYPFDHRLRDENPVQPVLVPDEGLDLDYHVRHTVLPGPGNDEQLADMVSRLHANLLDRERPLWEFHLIEGLADRRFAFYTKIHHAIVDGMTFARWFAESGSFRASDRKSPPIWQRDEPPRDRPHKDGLAPLISEGIKLLGGGVRTVADLSVLSARLVQRAVLERDRNAVLPLGAGQTRFNVPTGAARSFGMARYPLEEFQAIAHAAGASINDLVMALCDRAVNRYLEEHGDPPDEPLVVYMPVNLRGDDCDEDNLISLLQVKLASDHGDPLRALEQVREASLSTREIYGSVSRPAIQMYSLLVALLPLGEELLRLDQVLPPAINLVISNIPGPSRPMYFRGAEVTEVYPVNTLPPAVALSMTVCSYAGTMYFGLIGGRTAIPDLSRLRDFLDRAYADFREATGIGDDTQDGPPA